MNKTEIIDAVAADTGIGKAETVRVLDSVLDHITKTLKQGERVTLVGFGTFAPTRREAREGRNPRTGEPLRIPGSSGAKFSPGKELKAALNP